MQQLEGWEFIYSPHINKWLTTQRENRNLLYNDMDNKKVLKSSKITTLIDLIIKTEGNIDKLNKLIKNDL